MGQTKSVERRKNSIRHYSRKFKYKDPEESDKDDQKDDERSASSSDEDISRKSYSLNITFSSDKEKSDTEQKRNLKPPQSKQTTDKAGGKNNNNNTNNGALQSPLKNNPKAMEKVKN